ncbi:MAG: DUF5335 family protein [Gemmatimonadota bacterium]
MNTLIPRKNWVTAFNAFTKRNAGRTTWLEEYDVELGAQNVEHDYPLRGVSYDHAGHRIEIMVGDLEGTEHHLTRSIGNGLFVDLITDQHGKDQALRIERTDGGQTLLGLSAKPAYPIV